MLFVRFAAARYGDRRGCAADGRAAPSQLICSPLDSADTRAESSVTLLFLLVAVLVLAISLVAAVLAARSPIRQKWLWVAISLLGAPGVTVDWNTGQFLTRVALIQVLGAGVSRSTDPGAHWLITVAFPLGAVIFLARRRALIARASARPAPGAV